jgi:hypothetical protein
VPRIANQGRHHREQRFPHAPTKGCRQRRKDEEKEKRAGEPVREQANDGGPEHVAGVDRVNKAGGGFAARIQQHQQRDRVPRVQQKQKLDEAVILKGRC